MDFKSIIFVVGVIVVLSYFGFRRDNPINAARADEIRARAAQQAANNELARKNQAELNAIKIQERAARSAQVQSFWRWTGRAAMLSIMVVLFSVGVSFSMMFVGRAQASVERAHLEAKLIKVDPKTGQLPALADYMDGHFIIGELNDGSVMLLTKEQAADPQKVAGLIAIRHSLVAGKFAKETYEGEVRAELNPPIVQPQVIDLGSLNNLLENRSDKDE